MAGTTTSRSLLLWATVVGVLAATGDGLQAQSRRIYVLPYNMMYQGRRSQPMPSHSPATTIHPSYNQPPSGANLSGNKSNSASSPGIGSAAQAPMDRRPATVTPPTLTAPAAKADLPHQPAASERKNIPTMSANRAHGGEHLSEWMNQHGNLNPAQQQQALEKEPGFRELPGKTQQRLRDQLTQLNNMPPQQRARWVARTEAMEKLTPDQRAQVRGAMQQLASLPPEQRGPVQRSFRQLRDLPPEQRASAMSSERYRGQLNPAQQATLSNLMRVEPMLEPPEPRQGPVQH